MLPRTHCLVLFYNLLWNVEVRLRTGNNPLDRSLALFGHLAEPTPRYTRHACYTLSHTVHQRTRNVHPEDQGQHGCRQRSQTISLLISVWIVAHGSPSWKWLRSNSRLALDNDDVTRLFTSTSICHPIDLHTIRCNITLVVSTDK